MIIVWDEPKRLANIEKHGIDFAEIGPEFFLAALVKPARDGRWVAIDLHDGAIVVVFATLGSEAISIISARPASAKERTLLS
jgi:uncharacterized protein